MLDQGFLLEEDTSFDTVYKQCPTPSKMSSKSSRSFRRFRTMPTPFIDPDTNLSEQLEKVSFTEVLPESPRYTRISAITRSSPRIDKTKLKPLSSPSRHTLLSLIDGNVSRDSGHSSMDDDSGSHLLDFSDISAIEAPTGNSPLNRTLSFSDSSDNEDLVPLDDSPVTHCPSQSRAGNLGSNTRRSLFGVDKKCTTSTPCTGSRTMSVLSHHQVAPIPAPDLIGSSKRSIHERSMQESRPMKRRSNGDSMELDIDLSIHTSQDIKDALDSAQDGDDSLVGDFSKPHCLPTISGKNQDLMSISPQTMAAVITGQYSHTVDQVHVIDCRYPFEFDGGHIRGAINIWNRDVMNELYLKSDQFRRPSPYGKRTIIIFHCEFSSERGPKMSRFLRQMDREANCDHYPGLYYPEMYLLEGGYKVFYENHPRLCDPISYMPMAHPQYVDDVKFFRVKSKSWAGEKKSKVRGRRHLLM